MGRRHHISTHVGSTGCPSLCAALIYPGSGFPENPQISVEHNRPPPPLRRAGPGLTAQRHKSHCNLCCVISGFRCLPSPRRPEPSHTASMAGKSQSFISQFLLSHLDASLSFSTRPSQLLDLEGVARPLKYSSRGRGAACDGTFRPL